MALTRFYDREQNGDGPVSGALQLIAVPHATALATNTTIVERFDLPTGMAFKITDIKVFMGTTTAASTGVVPPRINVGATAAGTQIVNVANLVTGANNLTIKDGLVAAGGAVNIRIVSATNSSAALPISINVVGHVFTPPTSIDVR
jgi:hypothetical protein